MRFQARVEVQLRPGIADPEGATIERALPALGFDGVAHVRAGRSFSFEVDAPDEGRPGPRRPSWPIACWPTRSSNRATSNSRPSEWPLGSGWSSSRAPTASTTWCRRSSRWGAPASCSGTATRSGRCCGTPSSCPAGSPTATTSGPAPWPASPRSWKQFPPVRPAAGGPVIGICNGFQVLTEAGLLPGALQKNARLRFLCQPDSAWRSTSTAVGAHRAGQRRPVIAVDPDQPLRRATTPATPTTLRRLNDTGRVVLRYVDNPNGSVGDIAGIANAAGNVVGLMPHPERAVSELVGSEDGIVLLPLAAQRGQRLRRRLNFDQPRERGSPPWPARPR